MVLPFHAPLHAQRNQQPDRDSSDVNKKITPTMDRFGRRMHVQHWLSSPVRYRLAYQIPERFQSKRLFRDTVQTLVGCRLLDTVDDKNGNRFFRGFKFETKLLLDRSE